MKKADIKPGVVYAYQESRGHYGSPDPIVFLAAPADGPLYSSRSRLKKAGTAFSVAHGATKPKPSVSSIYGPTGYPAVMFDYGPLTDDDPARLLEPTLADFEAAIFPSSEDGLRFTVIAHLPYILGPYDEVVAERDEWRRAQDALAAELDRERDASRTRAIDIITAFSAHGITVNRIGTYGSVDSVSLPLDEAEKLIALLVAKDAQEG